MGKPPPDSFRAELLDLLSERDLTLRAFAESIDVAQPYLSQVLAGHRKVTPPLLNRAAKKLRVQPERWSEYREMVATEAIRRDPELCRRVYAKIPVELRTRIFRDLNRSHHPRSNKRPSD